MTAIVPEHGTARDAAYPTEVLDEARQALTTEFGELRADLEQVRGLVSDAIGKLSAGFQGLTAQIKAQSSLIQSMADQTGGDRGAKAGFQSFAAQAGDVLAQLGARIERTGANSAQTARQIEAVSGHMAQVSSLVGGVQQIASHTQLVALNAMIEAAHAGDAGRGFAVVATEVKALSTRSTEFGNDILTAVAQVQDEVRLAQSTIGSIAEDDTAFAAQARERVQGMLDEVEKVNAVLAGQLQHAAAVSRDILDHVSLSVTALQFDDMVNQLIAHIDRRLTSLEPLTTALLDPSPDHLMTALDQHYARVDAMSHKSVAQESMQNGDVELF